MTTSIDNRPCCNQGTHSHKEDPLSVCTELLGLIALHKPISHIAGAALLAIRAYHYYDSWQTNGNKKFDKVAGILVTAGAVAMLVKPLFTMTASTAVLAATNFISGDYLNAGRYALSFAAMTTGSVHIFVISLAAHSAFTLYRSYHFYSTDKPIQSTINLLISMAAAHAIYQRLGIFCEEPIHGGHQPPSAPHSCCPCSTNYGQTATYADKRRKDLPASA